jgi:molybdopterin biosynthesis enzyme
MNRENLLDKIRALLAKTVENGCTENEAMAAIDKARAMMDAYEVTEADLQLTNAESAVLRSEPAGSRDPHNVKRGLASAVA